MDHCTGCGRLIEEAHWTGTCYRCHLRGLSFTFRGAYANRESFHDETIAEVQRDIERNPNAERIGQRWV